MQLNCTSTVCQGADGNAKHACGIAEGHMQMMRMLLTLPVAATWASSSNQHTATRTARNSVIRTRSSGQSVQ
jgi:hypothetical protein